MRFTVSNYSKQGRQSSMQSMAPGRHLWARPCDMEKFTHSFIRYLVTVHSVPCTVHIAANKTDKTVPLWSLHSTS